MKKDVWNDCMLGFPTPLQDPLKDMAKDLQELHYKISLATGAYNLKKC